MIKTKAAILATCIILNFSFLQNLSAQTSTIAPDSSSVEIEKEHHDLNHLALFVGSTSKLEHSGSYFSLGLDYLHLLKPGGNWGVGTFGEVIFTHHPELVFGGLIYYRLINTFWARTGPGIEIIKEAETDPECGCEETNSRSEFLYRIGLGYTYHGRIFVISPSVDLDLARSETALVWGLNIGFSF